MVGEPALTAERERRWGRWSAAAQQATALARNTSERVTAGGSDGRPGKVVTR